MTLLSSGCPLVTGFIDVDSTTWPLPLSVLLWSGGVQEPLRRRWHAHTRHRMSSRTTTITERERKQGREWETERERAMDREREWWTESVAVKQSIWLRERERESE